MYTLPVEMVRKAGRGEFEKEHCRIKVSIRRGFRPEGENKSRCERRERPKGRETEGRADGGQECAASLPARPFLEGGCPPSLAWFPGLPGDLRQQVFSCHSCGSQKSKVRV